MWRVARTSFFLEAASSALVVDSWRRTARRALRVCRPRRLQASSLVLTRDRLRFRAWMRPQRSAALRLHAVGGAGGDRGAAAGAVRG